ncbi:MAG: hypothetical protein ACR2G2_03430 [Pseudonocardia sp.]
MSGARRTVVVFLAASGLALTVGVPSAAATESDAISCTASGHHADAKVSYQQAATDVLIDSIAVNIDKRAGQRNKVRLVVKDEGRVVFNYTSGNDVTAGPYLFDYSDNPIKVHPAQVSDEIQTVVTFEFDTPDSPDNSCTTTIRF